MKRLAVFACALMAFGFTSCATVWIQPQRALTTDQWLEYDLSGADAVALATIDGVTDTIVDIAADGSGIPTRSVRLAIESWLKGGDRSNVVRAGVSPLDDQPLRGADLLQAVHGAGRVLVLLRRLPDGWALADGPDPSGTGMRAVSPGDSRRVALEVQGMLARQDPDSLLARADVVVIGRCVDTAPCPSRPGLRCGRVVIDEVLAGKAPDTVAVFAPLVGDIPLGRAVHILRRAVPGEYETIGYQAGGQLIRDGRLVLWGLTEADLKARISARALRTPRRKVEP